MTGISFALAWLGLGSGSLWSGVLAACPLPDVAGGQAFRIPDAPSSARLAEMPFSGPFREETSA